MKNLIITIQVMTNNPESVDSSEIMDLVRTALEAKNPAPNWVLVPLVDVSDVKKGKINILPENGWTE